MSSNINDEKLTIGENTYMVDTEDEGINKADARRLIDQDVTVTYQIMEFNGGNILPQGYEPALDCAILDVACGPAGWIREVHRQHPHVKLVGIDNNKKTIAWAKQHEKTKHKAHISFELMDIMQPLAFPDHSFDFVNARFLTGVVPHDHWVPLIRECARVLKPGGTIQVTEAETSWMAGAPASSRLIDAILEMMWKFGRSYSRTAIAIAPMLPVHLKQGGLVDIRSETITLDWSWGTLMHENVAADLRAAVQIMRSQFQQMGILSERDLEELYVQMEEEMERETFRAFWPIVICMGRKPA